MCSLESNWQFINIESENGLAATIICHLVAFKWILQLQNWWFIISDVYIYANENLIFQLQICVFVCMPVAVWIAQQ